MKVILLAGGFGTRISEESQFKPKPMVELGGMPIAYMERTEESISSKKVNKDMKKSLGSNFIWNSIGTTFYCGCQWLLTVIVVYYRGGYSDAGILSLAMSITNVLIVIASLNLRNFQVSELDGKFDDGDFLLTRLLTSAVSLILCLCVVVYSAHGRYESICIMAFMVFKVSEVLADVFHGIDQRAWRLDIAGKSFILRGVATLVSIGCGMLFGGNLLFTICLMAALSYLIILFYDFRQCQKQFYFNFCHSRSNVVALIRIGIPLALYTIFLNLIVIFPRLQIEEQYGKNLLGIFSSIATPTVLVTQLASFIFNPLMGIFAECRIERNKKRLYRLLLITFGGTVIVGILSVIAGRVLGEWALVLLFGESIREYAYLLVPIIYTAILTAIIWLLCGLLTVFKDYIMLAALTSISMIVCMISSAPLIAEHQLPGAVLALTFALVVETLLLLLRFILLLKRFYKMVPGD